MLPTPTPPRRLLDPPLAVYVYPWPTGRRRRCLSLLSPAEASAAGGLHRAAILGTTEAPDALSADGFLPNPLFMDQLFAVAAELAHRLPALVRRAVFARRGELALWDGRSRLRLAREAREDVLGLVAVREGRVIEGSFLPNPDFTPLSDRGLLRLTDGLVLPLLDRLRALRVVGAPLSGVH